MKHYITLFLIAILSLPVNAIDVRVDVDSPSRVEISINDQPQSGVTAGVNTFDVSMGSTVMVAAKPGNMLVSVTETNDGWNDPLPLHAENGTQFALINVYGDYGDTYVVVSAPAEDLRSATLTLDVDNAAAVNAVFPATETTLDLINGANTLKFNPEQEKTIKLTPTGKDFYMVRKNGDPLPAQYSYTVAIADGDNITVEANYPDVDYTVTFNLEGYGAADFITAVDVDGKPEYNYLKPGFTVKAGSELKISGNVRDYEVLEFKINGMSATFANPTTILVTENVTLSLSVRQYASFPVTVNIDDPSRVTLYNGYYYNGNVVELTAGDNIVTVTRNTPRMALVANDGSYVVSVSYPEEELPVVDLQKPVIDLSPLYDNDVITIRTAAIERDNTAAIYISGAAEAEDYLKFTRADSSVPVAKLTDGYHVFSYFERDNPFRLSTGAPVDAHVYINDQAIEPIYPGSNDYDMSLAENDVLKVYYGEAPELYNVNILRYDMAVCSYPPDPQAQATVIRDQIQEVPLAGGENRFTALEGTLLTITPDANSYVVNFDDASQTECGKPLTITVTSDLFLAVESIIGGLDGVGADSLRTETGRYTPDGRRLTAPTPGVNIIRYSDGTTSRILVR